MLTRCMIWIVLSCFSIAQMSANPAAILEEPRGATVLKNKPNGLNPPFAILNNPSYHPGFFSALFTVIGFLSESKKSNWEGYVVDFEDNGTYYEESLGSNWWGYYFNPILKEPTSYTDDRVILEDQKMRWGLNVLLQNRMTVHQLIEEYIHPLPIVTEEVEKCVADLFENTFPIGISYQKPERSFSNSRLNFTNFFTATDNYLQKEEFFGCKIFVSTDDSDFLNQMILRYGDRVVYREVPRHDQFKKPVYYTHTPNFDRGFDEIVECLLLSKCGVIIRTTSHLSAAASFFNPFCDFITIRLNNVRVQGN